MRDHNININATATDTNLTELHPNIIDEDTELLDELATTFEGTFSVEESLNYEGDGQHRYYGSTSGRLQFQQSVPTDGPSPASPLLSLNPRAEMNKRILAEDDASISTELKEELTCLYFARQNPWLYLVDERLYRESCLTKDRYWSPLLESCILAMGSRFSDREDVRSDMNDANTAGRFFLERAELYLYYDLKYPTLTTIQALMILSNLSVVSCGHANLCAPLF